MDALALIMPAVLPFTEVIVMAEAQSGSIDPNIVLVASLFVMGEWLFILSTAARKGARHVHRNRC
jgi:hypothetical protein